MLGPRTTRIAAALPIALVLGALLPVGTATGAGETCQGRPATVVGSPGSTVTGTAGPDVVVTAGARQVDAGEGDDLICVDGGGPVAIVMAGPGADVVDATDGATPTVYVFLGPGADTFTGGGTEALAVHAGIDGELGEGDTDPDTITVSADTGADTTVYSGQSGTPNADAVRLAGAGDVRWEGPMTGSAELAGGSGHNRLLTTVAGDVAVDLAAGTKATGGSVDLRWTSFEAHTFFSSGDTSVTSFDMAGSRGDDDVDIALFRNATLPVTVDLAGGDDTVNTTFVGGPGSSYVGGAGRDRLGVATPGRVELDMGARGLKATHNGSTDRAEVRSFQDAQVWGRFVRIVGNGNDNRLLAGGCQHSVVRGAKGADRIRFERGAPVSSRKCRSDSSTVRFLGGRGHDHLVGGRNRDFLIGGAGRDLAKGRQGRDVCRAERTRGCEVTSRS